MPRNSVSPPPQASGVVERLGLARWRRNALTVLGNVGTPADLPSAEALLADADPMVAEHAAWSVGRLRAR